jgi:uncharacterized membrane protein YcaP (DUF421 family)
MWHEMLALQAPVGETMLRAVLVYVSVVILIRLTGRAWLS